MLKGEEYLYVDITCCGCQKLCAYPNTVGLEDGRRFCHNCMDRPSEKALGMVAFVDGVTNTFFGRSRTDSIMTLKCVTCGGKVTEFRDSLSHKEYTISGMCQACQDSVFGK